MVMDGLLRCFGFGVSGSLGILFVFEGGLVEAFGLDHFLLGGDDGTAVCLGLGILLMNHGDTSVRIAAEPRMVRERFNRHPTEAEWRGRSVGRAVGV
jgi:hypothetical protein